MLDGATQEKKRQTCRELRAQADALLQQLDGALAEIAAAVAEIRQS